MGAANVVQSGLRRGPSLKVIALIAVLGAAALGVQRARHHRCHRHHGHSSHAAPAALIMTPPRCVVSPPTAPAVAPAAVVAVESDPCRAALAAWEAVRNYPDVPSGTIELQRVQLRNQAIEACRAPHRP